MMSNSIFDQLVPLIIIIAVVVCLIPIIGHGLKLTKKIKYISIKTDRLTSNTAVADIKKTLDEVKKIREGKKTNG